MKVRLIKESSGFGYNGKVVDWLVSSSENTGILDALQNGKAVEIPEGIAKNIHNLVCVSTGEVISKSYTLFGITEEAVKTKYLEKDEATKSSIKAEFLKASSPTTKKVEVDEQIEKDTK